MFGASPESPRMFESDLVDRFSRVAWWVVPLIWVPVVGASVAAGWWSGASVPAIAAQLAAGWVAWTLAEYWLHREVFHWVPDTAWGERFHFYLHGVHHQWFRDPYRLVMPPAVSLTVGALLLGVLLGIGALLSPWLDPSWTWGAFAGITWGYLVYDVTHWYIHHARPKTRIGLALRAHHNKHHHNPKYADKRFGVSLTLWDHVFGTYE